MIITINLSIFIFEQHCFKSGSTCQFLTKSDTKLVYFNILFCFFFLNGRMFVKCGSHTKGGQEKENQSQQIPTFSYSEWSILKICIAKIFLLSTHVAITCPPPSCPLSTLQSLMAPMVHHRHQPSNGKGYVYI